MTQIVLGVDQGTSSTRCLALDRELRRVAAEAVAVGASFPAAGLVEQDPSELAASAEEALAGALRGARASRSDVAAVGIANQTETFVIARRATGEPIHPAISWQDRRTADVCAALAAAGHESLVRARTGLELDATFPATKVAWVLDHIPGARAAAEAGELVYHDVGSWLLWHLTGARACDVGNAGRTLLCALGRGWDDELLGLFDVPRALLPPIVDTDGVADAVRGHRAGEAALPVTAVAGDQQASLFGLGCRSEAMAKVTLGTGAFVLAHAGASGATADGGTAGATVPGAPGLWTPPSGVLGSCAWRVRGETSVALEGFVPAAGAALDWCAQIGLLPAGPELDALLRDVGPEDAAVACVPALQGLGTPSWDAGARGSLLGLSRATTRAQIARAAVDGVLHQVADALAAIGETMPITTVLLDGGLSRSDWIVQRLADLAGVQVRRAVWADATAIGAAMFAGLAAGFWDDPDDIPTIPVDRVTEPSLDPSTRAMLRARWAQAVAVATAWRP